jgi:chromosome segregation ATPase
MVSFSPFALLLVSAFAIAITALPTTVVPEEDFAEDLTIAHTDTPAQLPAELLSTSVHPTKVQQNEANTKTATKTHSRNPLHAIHKLVMKLPKQHRHFAKSLIQSHLAQMSTRMCDGCNESNEEEETQDENPTCTLCHSNYHHFPPTYPPPMAYPSYGYHNPSYLWHQHFAASAHHWHREQLEREAQDDREKKFKRAKETREKITEDLNTANAKLAQLQSNIKNTKQALIIDLEKAELNRKTIQTELTATHQRQHAATTADLKKRLKLHATYLKDRLKDATGLRNKINAELTHLSNELDSAKNHRNNLLTTITDNQLHVHNSLRKQIKAAKSSIVQTLLEALKAAGKAKIAAIVDSLQSSTEIGNGSTFKQNLEDSIGGAIDAVCQDYEPAVEGITCDEDRKQFAVDKHHVANYKDPFAKTQASAAPVTQLLMQLPRQHRSLAKSLIQTYRSSVLYATCKRCQTNDFKNCTFLKTHFLHRTNNCDILAHSHAYAAYTGPAHAAQLWHHHWHNAHQWNHRNMLSSRASADREDKFGKAQKHREQIQETLKVANAHVKTANKAVDSAKEELQEQLSDAKEHREKIKKELQTTTKKLHVATTLALKTALEVHAKDLDDELFLARNELVKIRGQLKELRDKLRDARAHRQELAKRITDNQAGSHKSISDEIHSLKKTVINTFMHAITVEGDMEIQGIMSALKSSKTYPTADAKTFQATLQDMLHTNVKKACMDYQDQVEGMKCEVKRNSYEESKPYVYNHVTSSHDDNNESDKFDADTSGKFDADTDAVVSQTAHDAGWKQRKEAEEAAAKKAADAAKRAANTNQATKPTDTSW